MMKSETRLFIKGMVLGAFILAMVSLLFFKINFITDIAYTRQSIAKETPTLYHCPWKTVTQRHCASWLKLQANLHLSESDMKTLLASIKDINYCGHGAIYQNLTYYPQEIERALLLCVSHGIETSKDLEGLLDTLKMRFLRSRSFPDELDNLCNLYAVDHLQAQRLIIILFFEHILTCVRQ